MRVARSPYGERTINRGFRAENPLSLLLTDEGSVLVAAPALRRFGQAAEARVAVFTGHVLETVHSTLELAAHTANAVTGYQGAWKAGLPVTGLSVAFSTQALNKGALQRYNPYPAEQFLMTTDTTTQEMAEAPSQVVERLVKRLRRGLSVADRCLPFTLPSDILRHS